MTRVYVFDRGSEPVPDGAAELLPAWRRSVYDGLRRAGPRQESLCAGLLYAHALRDNGLAPEEPVTRLPAGRPVFAGRGDAYFSLSHSGRYALCAVSGAPVGADVQEPRPVKPSILRYFHPDERTWLLSRPETGRAGDFLCLWTRKEAWVKAVSAERVLSLAETDVLHPPPGLYFWDYILPDGYRAAVCTRGDDPGELIPVRREALLAAR